MATPMFSWNLPRLMSESRIRYNTDLIVALKPYGFTFTRSGMSRIVNGEVLRIDLGLIVALCRILHCKLSDLVVISGDEKPGQESPVASSARAARSARAPRRYQKPTARPIGARIHGLNYDL
jgi:DNA-binding Xre family transcriptional regulator